MPTSDSNEPLSLEQPQTVSEGPVEIQSEANAVDSSAKASHVNETANTEHSANVIHETEKTADLKFKTGQIYADQKLGKAVDSVERQEDGRDIEKEAYKAADVEEDNVVPGELQDGEENGDDSKSEIQSIMGQFENGMNAPGADEIMSPRLDLAGPLRGSPVVGHHPPRQSSLEPLTSASSLSLNRESSGSQPPPRSSSLVSMGSGLGIISSSNDEESESLSQSISQLQPTLPPRPDPEPDLPFDFHRFLEQLRHRTADPVAKFLRSFLQEFGKKPWMVHEQVKIISDFLEFISKKMAQCDVWKSVSDAEYDNACEGMEKLVMNRLYSQTFSPAIPLPDPALAGRKRRTGQLPPGRRGQHQEDVERDDILVQKVRIYSWVREEHLDINPLNEKGKKFLVLAQKELLKIGNYRAPRDKVICILNCCKVIFGFLRNAHHDQSADSFIPLLIYTVLRANPPNLVSNVQYILRFRNANKLTGEAGYYVSSLGGALDFIERLDRTSLTISNEEFEKNVEASVSAIAEGHRATTPPEAPLSASLKPPTGATSGSPSSPRRSVDTQRPPKSPRAIPKPDTEVEESPAITGILRTIQKPLSTIGRIFGDEPSTPLPSSTASAQALVPPLPFGSSDARSQSSAQDAAARQASKEAEDTRRIRAREEAHMVETLCGMFPDLDREVVVDVVRANEGRIGTAVDACLALSG